MLTIREYVTVNLDHVCLDNQSHYSLEVIEFQSVVLAFMDRPTAEIKVCPALHKLHTVQLKLCSILSVTKNLGLLL